MANDPIAALAVGVAADHQAQKRKNARKTAAPDTATETEGGAELKDAVADLGDAINARDADDDRATDFMIDRMTAIANEATMASGTLVGDVRDTLLDLFKANPKPWSSLLEDQQRRIADGLEHCAQVIIRAIVVIVAEDDAQGATIHAKLESYAEKGGLKIALTANGDRDTVLALHDAVGQQVVVKRADTNRYAGQRRGAEIDPNQPGLAFEGDADTAADPFAAPAGDEDLAGNFADDQDNGE